MKNHRNTISLIRSTPWQYLPYSLYTGPEAMGTDEWIFSQIQSGTMDAIIRIYGWSKPCVTFGYFQRIPHYLKTNPKQSAHISHIPFIRRITGGRAVYHHLNPTFSICFRISKVFGCNVNKHTILTTLNSVLAHILRDANIAFQHTPNIAYENKQYAHTINCFATCLAHELRDVHGNKLLGSALKVEHEVALQQGVLALIPEQFNLSCLEENKQTENNLANLTSSMNKTKSLHKKIKNFTNSFLSMFQAKPWAWTHKQKENISKYINVKCTNHE